MSHDHHHEDGHVCTCNENVLVPQVCTVIKITQETPDVRTFRIQTKDGKRPFTPLPGQLGMFSLLGVGEAMFSVTAFGDDWIETSIKRTGLLTDALHAMSEGQDIGVRGPYGNHFPLEECKGKDILFIGGGIGIAPVRSFIRYAFAHREDYGQLDILYGSRSKSDLVFKEDLFENWPKEDNTHLHLTIDREDGEWDGHIDMVPMYLEKLGFATENRKVILCGPPIMIKFTLQALLRMGFDKSNCITTLEMRMKCGVGKCGRCNIGSKLVCLDGPVFTMNELDDMPDEM